MDILKASCTFAWRNQLIGWIFFSYVFQTYPALWILDNIKALKSRLIFVWGIIAEMLVNLVHFDLIFIIQN